jgi:hypothetical protein
MFLIFGSILFGLQCSKTWRDPEVPHRRSIPKWSLVVLMARTIVGDTARRRASNGVRHQNWVERAHGSDQAQRESSAADLGIFIENVGKTGSDAASISALISAPPGRVTSRFIFVQVSRRSITNTDITTMAYHRRAQSPRRNHSRSSCNSWREGNISFLCGIQAQVLSFLFSAPPGQRHKLA